MDETIFIPHCPHCTRRHAFVLQVTRDHRTGAAGAGPEPMPVLWVRMARPFTCPVTKETFQGLFTLTTAVNNRITSVDVVGPADS